MSTVRPTSTTTPELSGEAPADPKREPADPKRRRLLFAFGAGGASAAAATVAAAPGALAVPQAASPTERPSGYHESDHVRDYYRTARV
jgi:hypothetical protein